MTAGGDADRASLGNGCVQDNLENHFERELRAANSDPAVDLAIARTGDLNGYHYLPASFGAAMALEGEQDPR